MYCFDGDRPSYTPVFLVASPTSKKHVLLQEVVATDEEPQAAAVVSESTVSINYT